jgi:hypothetical protein
LQICYCYIIAPRQGQKEQIKDCHYRKIKSGKEIRQSKPPTSLSKALAQHKVESLEEEDWIETTFLKK